MNRITSRFVLLIATAAVLPLVIYGAISVRSLRSGTSQSVRDGNQRMAERVANQIGQYLRDNIRVLQSVSAEISGTSLEGWQQERILKDYVLSFPEFREVTLFDAAGQPLATSAIGAPRVRLPVDAAVKERSTYIAPVRVDDDLPRRQRSSYAFQDRTRRHNGWSERSRSNNYGGWWTRSISMRVALPSSSARTGG